MTSTPDADSPDSGTTRPSRLDFAQVAYDQVLDATKHQDDKIGRFLTALAFLTTGAIALLFRQGLLSTEFVFQSQLDFAAGNFPLVAWATLGFFLCVLLSVILLLLSLSTPLKVPDRRGDREPRIEGSRLFFAYIGREPLVKWMDRWTDATPEILEEEFYRQYVRETHNLAERARAKYQHTNEASALFVLSLLFLGIAVALTIVGSLPVTNDVTGAAALTTFCGQVAIAVGIASSLHAAVLVYGRLVHERQSFQTVADAASRNGDQDAQQWFDSTRSLRWLLLTVPAYVMALAIPGADKLDRLLGLAFALTFLTVGWALTRVRRPETCLRCSGGHALIYLVAPTMVATAAMLGGGLLQLAGILVPSVWFSVVAVTDGYRRHLTSERRVAATYAPADTAASPGAMTTSVLALARWVHGDRALETIATVVRHRPDCPTRRPNPDHSADRR